MNRLEFAALAVEQSLEMHEAARVIGDDVLGARLLGGRAPHLAHGGGNHGKLRGERPAESTADFLGHFDQFQSADFGQELTGRFLVA